MLGIENVLSFLLAATLIIVIPGPATFYVIGKAQLTPWQAGYATLGIVAGDLLLITVSGLGFASLVAQWPVLMLAVKLGGAAYVLYLGVNLLKSPARTKHQARALEDKPGEKLRGFVTGILITLTNPKPILFFAAFFPMFIKAGATSLMQSFYMLGIYFELLNLCYFSALILIVARLRQWPTVDRFLAGGFSAVSGMGLLGCGAFVLATSFR